MTTNLKLLGAGLLLLSSFPAMAVPAYPGFITARQQDGTELTIRRVGDEYHNMVLSSDGYALLFNAATHNYEYALLEADGFVTSGVVASDPDSRSPEAVRMLENIDREAVEARFAADMALARDRMAPKPVNTGTGPQRIVRISDVPTTGKHDVLVILVEFADRKFSDCEAMSDPKNYYDRFFHESGFSDYGCHGSVYDYYFEGSCERYDPDFRVFGPVTVSGGYADYAGSGGSAYTYKMIQEAIPLVDAQYDVDFADFDTDGDGVIDNVYCLYAGYGQADSPVRDSIWPHSYNLKATHNEFDVDGVTVDRYTVSQQVNGQSNLPVGIGTFVHEFGHVLGLADHYNNSLSLGNPANNVGNWDVMSSGSYNNDQNCPAPFSAFERYSLGWTEPVELDPREPSMIEMTPYMDSGQCYRLTVKPDDKEYFLIENRQQKDWDEYLPGHGILVWHIEEDQVVWDINRPNADQNHQRVDIVEAAGILTSTGHSSDAFPGTSNVRQYNFMDWANNKHFGFEWVEEDEEGNCRFLLSNSGYVLPDPKLECSDVMGTSATLSWGECDMANNYEITVLNGDEEVFYHAAEEPGSVSVTDLEPETEYRVKILARLNSLKSEYVEKNFTTLTRQIEEYLPEAMPAREISDESFLARWRDLPIATDYTIQLYGRSHDAQGELLHGFDDFSTSDPRLPEGWDITPKQGRNDNDFGQAAPSIRLRDDDAYLLISVPGEKMDSIGFWFSPSKAGIVLTVEKSTGDEWNEVWRYATDRKRELTQMVDVEGSEPIRLRVSREEGVSGGYLLLDDISVYYIHDRFSAIRTVNVGPAYDNPFIAGDVNSYMIDGLMAGEKYGFRVRAEADGRFSPWSEVMNVEEGMEDPEDPNAVGNIGDDTGYADEEEIIYNLQGIRIKASVHDLPSGVYIINGRKVIVGN